MDVLDTQATNYCQLPMLVAPDGVFFAYSRCNSLHSHCALKYKNAWIRAVQAYTMQPYSSSLAQSYIANITHIHVFVKFSTKFPSHTVRSQKPGDTGVHLRRIGKAVHLWLVFAIVLYTIPTGV